MIRINMLVRNLYIFWISRRISLSSLRVLVMMWPK